jgi:hypothetical protein
MATAHLDTEAPGKVLGRTMFVHVTGKGEVKVLPNYEVEYAGLGKLIEPVDVRVSPLASNRGNIATKSPAKVVTRIEFVDEATFANRRLNHDGHAGPGMVGLGSTHFA